MVARMTCPIQFVRISTRKPHSSGKARARRWQSLHRLAVHRLGEVRALDAEVVQYRAKVRGRTSARKTVRARVPVAVKELLRLRAQRGGVQVPEGRLARLSVEFMAEYAYDPVSAVASLAPLFFICPVASTRMLGAGDNGAVFLEERTGHVIKVMLDDDAPDEYKHLRAFASIGLAPQPIDLWGPRDMGSEKLYNIRMEAVDYTLSDLLGAEAPGSKRSSPSESVAQQLGQSLASVLLEMRTHGLVHGDLHAGNVGLKKKDSGLSVLLLDFSRSANLAEQKGRQCSEDFLSGHEYDVFNALEGVFASFEDLSYDVCDDVRKEKQLLRALEKKSGSCARKVEDARKCLAKKRGALQQAELVHNCILRPLTDYARTLRGWSFDGCPTVRNLELKRIVRRRLKTSYAAYFKSDLYWGDWQYKE